MAQETGLSSYYHPPQHPPSTTAPLHPNTVTSGAATTGPVSNGAATVSPLTNDVTPDAANTTAPLYPQSVVGKAPTPPSLDTVRKKRGRPRKYATPEEAAAAKRAASTSLSREQQVGIGSPSLSSTLSKRSRWGSEDAAGTGQCFMPHVINVNPGEDVAQKILLFVQQSPKELCILSASGCVCNASLLQPDTPGGSLTYEGRFDILSFSGSFVHKDHGERSGRLSACLVAQDGHVIGGGITGPLIAAEPVEVILATFQMVAKNDKSGSNRGQATTAETLAPLTNSSVSPTGYRPVLEPSPHYAVAMNDDHQNVGATPFLIHHPRLQIGSSQSTGWRVGLDSVNNFNFNLTGRTGHETNESLENGDYEHLQDRDC